MPTLTPTELTDLRRELAAGVSVVRWTKPQVNAVTQALEDWFEANRPALGTAMEAAAPGVFTTAQKRALVTAWLEQKFRRGG
jgi:hypothetical protein